MMLKNVSAPAIFAMIESKYIYIFLDMRRGVSSFQA
jgi:hypothetical protein